ncbi:unnamed protein product [Trypanosoma congolense IL3000]|uniref:WGS project CAEQ00000000 data, annotated contig 7 n=1 Tax=Trypanosoma congolense (strain IL3000) TaxID=1068625 RepID=F9WI18_TRYCI|nr:unnamed protein product [Trypanosoma congolense IL3000]
MHHAIGEPMRSHDASALQLTKKIYLDTTASGAFRAHVSRKEKVHTMRRVKGFRDNDQRVWVERSMLLDVPSGALAYPQDSFGKKAALGVSAPVCSYRTQCVAMGAVLERLVKSIGRNAARKTKAAVFLDSLSPLMVLNTGRAVVIDTARRCT